MADLHGGEPRAATPVSPETAAHIQKIKAEEPEKAAILSSSLDSLAAGLAASMNDEKISQAAAASNSANKSTAVLKTPSIKLPDFNDVGKKINSVLGSLKTPDMANLQGSLDTASQAPDPNALSSFEEQMNKQSLARSAQRSADLTASLKNVNGFRNEM